MPGQEIVNAALDHFVDVIEPLKPLIEKRIGNVGSVMPVIPQFDEIFASQRLQVAVVGRIEGDDQVEYIEIGFAHLPRAQTRDVDPVVAGDGDRVRARRFPDVPVPRPRRIDGDGATPLLYQRPRHPLGDRRAADISEADEEDGFHGGTF